MTVTAVRKDPARLTMTVDAEFDAPPDRIWQLWADPRQLERWWGPPTYPATVTAHDLRPGGRVEYHMTGPSGDQPHGYWEVLEAEAPRRLVFREGFANADGTPNADMPITEHRVTITAVGGAQTRMSIENRFPDAAAMEQLLGMGMQEGMREAVGQIDGILAGAASSPTGRYQRRRRIDRSKAHGDEGAAATAIGDDRRTGWTAGTVERPRQPC